MLGRRPTPGRVGHWEPGYKSSTPRTANSKGGQGCSDDPEYSQIHQLYTWMFVKCWFFVIIWD